MKRLLTIFITLILISSTLPVGALSPNENLLLKGLNAERANNGLPPLTLNLLLSEVARRYCGDMVTYGFFDHISAADGSNPYQRVERSGYYEGYSGPKMVAENLGLTSGGVDVEYMLNEWMGSPEHRANILTTQMNEVGVGITVGTYRNTPNTALYAVLFAYRTRATESTIISPSTLTWVSRTTLKIQYFTSSKAPSTSKWIASTSTVNRTSATSTSQEIKSSTVLHLQKTRTVTIVTLSSSRPGPATTILESKLSTTLRSTTVHRGGDSPLSTFTLSLKYSQGATQAIEPSGVVALPGFTSASIVAGLLISALSICFKRWRRNRNTF